VTHSQEAGTEMSDDVVLEKPGFHDKQFELVIKRQLHTDTHAMPFGLSWNNVQVPRYLPPVRYKINHRISQSRDNLICRRPFPNGGSFGTEPPSLLVFKIFASKYI